MEDRMQVQDLMSRDVVVIDALESLGAAAKRMAELDVGVLPVSDEERLVGMITDRDMVVRGLAQGKGVNAKVKDVMTRGVKYCYLDQEIDEITANMADIQVRRLPVLDHDKRLVGILSLGDMVASGDPECVVEALGGISRPTSDVLLESSLRQLSDRKPM